MNKTCCQRGDWDGYPHQPASAYLYVPYSIRPWLRGESVTTFVAETTDEYRWECIYCGTVGTANELRA